MHLKLLLLLIGFINSIFCWPEYHLYTKQSQSKFALVSPQNLTNSGFSHQKETKILIHGFGDSGQITRLLKVKEQLLISNDFNVIVVDWEKGAAAPNYLAAAGNIKITGQKVAEFIFEAKILPSKVHCIGHSLGAHGCGFAGKVQKFKRISGLDPAGPLFKGKTKENRLDKTDAEFVDIIHTDWVYGIQDPIGHKDFYPNGGSSQFGCNLFDGLFDSKSADPKFDPIDLVACSHMRVPLYYAESINSKCKFESVPCDNHDNFKAGKCQCSEKYGCASMGYLANTTAEEGKFYLDTNRVEPYCKK